MKTIKLYTLGCKVNQYDTQAIREQFFSSGFKEICNGKGADVCVINTCTVTHRADSDSIGAIRRAIRDNPKAKIIVTGCLTELDGDRIKEIKGVNLIVKNNDKGSIAERSCGKRHCEPRRGEAISFFKGRTRAFLKIQDGCDNFCSYCKVPLVRGRSRSRRLEDVICEAERLAKNGFKEIVLTGICLGAYGKDLKPKKSLVDVLEKLEDIDG
ncbi:MAG: tRNA (N(6)-L-threonylcarbamoyladenosine(37)-C(2))-methylthiotransferase MtaB, partial [Candidatus Omnitrophica bacterium]|nr:tRNA (N(6)-L-threonylcarbamoyladenosine(37)-C(2))-methylthiotransferase MtaB [Candidatus Omnitrophota bacterium]